MDLVESFEVRWFLGTGHPGLAAAQRWFADTRAEPTRFDCYLRTERDDLSIKVRGSAPIRCDTKQRLASLGVAVVASGSAGKLERWRKITINDRDFKMPLSAPWISVEKRRRQRRFAVRSGVVRPLAPDLRAEAGCSIELTELGNLPGDAALSGSWTLGLETFGSEGDMLECLQATWLYAVEQGLGVAAAQDSMSYPEWLCACVDQRLFSSGLRSEHA